MNEWISVKERLPKEEEEVLTFGRLGCVVGYYSEELNDWQATYADCETGEPWLKDGEVTHWMDLPDAPKDKAE